MEQQYTNELIPELAASLARPPFSAEKKAGMSEGARQKVEEQKAFLLEHPVVAIYRIAVDGAQQQPDILPTASSPKTRPLSAPSGRP